VIVINPIHCLGEMGTGIGVVDCFHGYVLA
jgi:hypothetical protein